MEEYKITIEYVKEDDLRIMRVTNVTINSSIWLHFETREEAVRHALYYVSQYMKDRA